jgi:hypothetical protein
MSRIDFVGTSIVMKAVVIIANNRFLFVSTIAFGDVVDFLCLILMFFSITMVWWIKL